MIDKKTYFLLGDAVPVFENEGLAQVILNGQQHTFVYDPAIATPVQLMEMGAGWPSFIEIEPAVWRALRHRPQETSDWWFLYLVNGVKVEVYPVSIDEEGDAKGLTWGENEITHYAVGYRTSELNEMRHLDDFEKLESAINYANSYLGEVTKEFQKPVTGYKMHEALVDIVDMARSMGYRTADSRDFVSQCIGWAEEFERRHSLTEWGVDGEDDYLETIDRFTEMKVKAAVHERGRKLPPLDKWLTTLENVVDGLKESDITTGKEDKHLAKLVAFFRGQ